MQRSALAKKCTGERRTYADWLRVSASGVARLFVRKGP